ncbi:Nif3-like dinuclear metal center hexameric protein [Caldisalinibacter kiritimatiensis]|nr:Nif3-like dinuclear metal center hexameric protein [Caldisalinibacter kiritimatiensis]
MYKLAPPYLIDSWDNSGLQIGRENKEVKTILLALDLTPNVIKQAVSNNVNMIITHHPMLFKKIGSITTNDVKGKMIYDIINNDMVVFSAHTNLDVCENGVNDVLAQKLGLLNTEVLRKSYEEKLYKLTVYVPKGHADKVRRAITEAGGGWIGNYSHCTYNLNGIGTFMARENTNPFIGEQNRIEEVEEIRIETIVKHSILDTVINAMIDAHPYEEVAYDVYPLINRGIEYGYGRVGNLEKETDLKTFVELVKTEFKCDSVRIYGDLNKKIKRVAVCGGSGGDFIADAKRKRADVYITADIKYHDAQLMQELDIALIDANHYDTEKVILPYLKEYLQNNLDSKVKILISDDNSAPFTVK